MRLTVNLHWGANITEFLAIGTAVKAEVAGNWRAPEDKPFTSDLSGQDFWTLLHAGYRPLGFVTGNCVYYIGQPMPVQGYPQQGAMPGYPQQLQGYPHQGAMPGYPQQLQRYPQQATLQNMASAPAPSPSFRSTGDA